MAGTVCVLAHNISSVLITTRRLPWAKTIGKMWWSWRSFQIETMATPFSRPCFPTLCVYLKAINLRLSPTCQSLQSINQSIGWSGLLWGVNSINGSVFLFGGGAYIFLFAADDLEPFFYQASNRTQDLEVQGQGHSNPSGPVVRVVLLFRLWALLVQG